MQLLWVLPSLAFGIYMGIASHMWQMTIMSGITVVVMLVSLMVRRRRLKLTGESQVFFGESRVAIDDRVLPRSMRFWRQEWIDLAWQAAEAEAGKLMAARELEVLVGSGFRGESQQGGATYCAGFSLTDSKPIWVDLSTNPHAFVVGQTGAGKSQFLSQVLTSILSTHDLTEVRLALADFKGGATLAEFVNHPQCLAFVTDLHEVDQQKAFWDYLDHELKTRQLALAEAGVASIEQLPSLPRLVVVIDELATVLNQSNRPQSTIESLAARGRSLGVHLICSSQSLSGIPRSLLTNLKLRFALGAVDPIEIAQLGKAAPNANGNAQMLQLGEPGVAFNFVYGVRPAPTTGSQTPAREQPPPVHW